MAEQKPTPTPSPERRSRFEHFRAWLGRQARGHRTDTIAIFVLAFVGIVMMLGIFTQQKASLPSWLPLVGEEFDSISAEFTTAQAVTPGQGQAVDIAGIQIGKVSSVNLEDGHAVVGMDIEPKYMKLIHPDAQFLLRPKTGLNDMVVEVEPGSGKGEVKDGHRFGLAQTEPNVQLDQFLASLDADTRQYIQLLVAGGAQGIGGRGKQLGNALRRFEPFVEYTAKLNKAIAGRRTELAKVIHDFGELTTELGRHDSADPPLRLLLRQSARQLRQPAGSGRSGLRRVPGDAADRQGRARQLERILEGGAADADQADPAGAGLDPGLQGDREAVQPDDEADPRRHPALHPRSAAAAEPDQRRAPNRWKRRCGTSATASAVSTPSSTNWPTSRRATRRATSSTCPG